MKETVAYTKQKILHSEASATAVGQTLNVQGLIVAACQVSGTYTSMYIDFQGTIDGSNWVRLRSVRHDGQKFGRVTANGIYMFPVDGLVDFRANLKFTTGTSVTVVARAASLASGILTLPAGTPSPSSSESPSISPSVSPSISPSSSVSPSVSPSISPSSSVSSSESASASPST